MARSGWRARRGGLASDAGRAGVRGRSIDEWPSKLAVAISRTKIRRPGIEGTLAAGDRASQMDCRRAADRPLIGGAVQA